MKVTSSKIGGSIANSDAANATGKANKTNLDSLNIGKASNAKASPLSSEKVNLSQRVLDMQKIKELATPTNSVDEAKVARLQKMIDEGEYKVDGEAVADRLLAEHLNLPS
jgi:flagellar biosynthesis anti-sigma factor FlgM